MRVFVLLLGLLIALPAISQQSPKKKKTQVSHKKPTPEQIRKFKELEKRQKKI